MLPLALLLSYAIVRRFALPPARGTVAVWRDLLLHRAWLLYPDLTLHSSFSQLFQSLEPFDVYRLFYDVWRLTRYVASYGLSPNIFSQSCMERSVRVVLDFYDFHPQVIDIFVHIFNTDLLLFISIFYRLTLTEIANLSQYVPAPIDVWTRSRRRRIRRQTLRNSLNTVPNPPTPTMTTTIGTSSPVLDLPTEHSVGTVSGSGSHVSNLTMDPLDVHRETVRDQRALRRLIAGRRARVRFKPTVLVRHIPNVAAAVPPLTGMDDPLEEVMQAVDEAMALHRSNPHSWTLVQAHIRDVASTSMQRCRRP